MFKEQGLMHPGLKKMQLLSQAHPKSSFQKKKNIAYNRPPFYDLNLISIAGCH